MTKTQQLKKQLIKTASIAGVVSLVCCSAAYAIYSWSDGLQVETKRAESALNRARADVRLREDKHQEAKRYLELYEQIISKSEQDKISDLGREKAQNWLRNAATANNIMNMDGAVDAVTLINNPAFKKDTLEGITSNVTLKFDAMTDEQIYRFLQDIEDNFPGYIKVTSFAIEKKHDIDDSILRSAGQGNFPKLVSGELHFSWIGVREVTQTDANAGRRR